MSVSYQLIFPVAVVADASRPLAEYVPAAMTNRFGVVLHSESVRWAAAEGVSETVIAAVLLLHERSVDEIVTKLNAVELEQVVKLVGRSPHAFTRPGRSIRTASRLRMLLQQFRQLGEVGRHPKQYLATFEPRFAARSP